MDTKLKIPCYKVNAFIEVPFRGNPEIVCYLEDELSESIMQKIAFEMNVSETVFIIKAKDKINLRWFTPKTEVPICGHATLAAAYVLFNEYQYKKMLFNYKDLLNKSKLVAYQSSNRG